MQTTNGETGGSLPAVLATAGLSLKLSGNRGKSKLIHKVFQMLFF